MSVEAMAWVLRHSPEVMGRRLVLLVLADYANDESKAAWPSVANIAARARLSVRQTQRCLRELEAAGSIIRTGSTRKGTHVYAVVMGGDILSGGDISDTGGVTSATEGGDTSVTRSPIESTTNEPSDNLPAAPGSSPPKLVKVDGRDLAFDALAEVCGIREGSPRLREVAVALNGTRTQPGIREQAWSEWAQDLSRAWAPVSWEYWLADEVVARAMLYRRKMPGVALTPPALAKWWTDLPGLPDPGGKSGSAADVVGAIDAAVRQERGQ